mgnify:CR=1 FL=1
MKNLSVIGVGRLGLCLALVLERKGFNVVGCDINKNYVDSLNEKTFSSLESNVTNFLLESKNFKATTCIKETVQHSDVIFTVVRTESEPDGKYDHSQVDSVVDSLISLGVQQNTKHFVISCNVSPGYSDSVAERLEAYNWTVSFNPETVRQGTIIQDYLKPSCVYIGSNHEEPMRELEYIHEVITGFVGKIHVMDRISAELTKVSLNCFLTAKISFANMVGDLANKIGADANKVLAAVGTDARIGTQYFKYGFGFGGPCFPRDNRAFVRCAKDNNSAYDLCAASDSINEKHLKFQIQHFVENNDINTPVKMEHVTFKKGTDSLEESQQLKFAVALAELGYKVHVSEPSVVVSKLKDIYGDLFIYE